jgi:Asp-tRNA(Asn)/Glu-tRNA(Gln) amidotransferase A subunit family amidase
MVADSQPDAATACAVLPGSFGPGPLPAVIRIPGNYTITLRYRTDEQALQALLPLSLTVAEPVISFRCRRAEGIEWADGTSHFAGAAVTVDVACADGTTLRGMHYAVAIQAYQRAARVAAAFLEDWDLLLSPTLATTPAPLGTLPSGPGASVTEVWRAYLRFSPFAPIANLTGQPAISLPLARSTSGSPIGMMFTAGLGREDTLLRLAGQLEAASPWPAHANAANAQVGEG